MSWSQSKLRMQQVNGMRLIDCLTSPVLTWSKSWHVFKYARESCEKQIILKVSSLFFEMLLKCQGNLCLVSKAKTSYCWYIKWLSVSISNMNWWVDGSKSEKLRFISWSNSTWDSFQQCNIHKNEDNDSLPYHTILLIVMRVVDAVCSAFTLE